jgi:hypothetical protein
MDEPCSFPKSLHEFWSTTYASKSVTEVFDKMEEYCKKELDFDFAEGDPSPFSLFQNSLERELVLYEKELVNGTEASAHFNAINRAHSLFESNELFLTSMTLLNYKKMIHFSLSFNKNIKARLLFLWNLTRMCVWVNERGQDMMLYFFEMKETCQNRFNYLNYFPRSNFHASFVMG